MAKRKIKAAEQAAESPTDISGEAFAFAMQRLLKNEDYQILRRVQLAKRIKIIEDIKATEDPVKSALRGAKLSGFDESFMVPMNAAARGWSEEKKNELAESLQAILRGN